MQWLKHEYAISAENVINLVNAKNIDAKCCIAYAMENNNHHWVEEVLKQVGSKVILINSHLVVPTHSPWIQIIRSRNVELIAISVIAILDDDIKMDKSTLAQNISNIVEDREYNGYIASETPLLWAASNRLYSLLQVMLKVQLI